MAERQNAAERRVWLAQCLCGPNRHAIAALAGEFGSRADAEAGLLPPLREGVAQQLRCGIWNPWCAICGAEEAGWRYELSRTAFRTMAEAAPTLAVVAEANARTNAVFGTHGPKKPCPS